jgi:hypothetical protein
LEGGAGLVEFAQGLEECPQLIVRFVVHHANVDACFVEGTAKDGLHQGMGRNFHGDGIWRDLLQGLIEENLKGIRKIN